MKQTLFTFSFVLSLVFFVGCTEDCQTCQQIKSTEFEDEITSRDTTDLGEICGTSLETLDTDSETLDSIFVATGSYRVTSTRYACNN